MRITILGISALWLTSCAVPTAYLTAKTAEHTPCEEDDVTVVGENPPSGRGDFDWTANCQERTFSCQHRLQDDEVTVTCNDSSGAPAAPAASAPAEPAPPTEPEPEAPGPDTAAMIGHLANQTWCASDQIRELESSGGTVTFDACNNRYRCNTAADGATHCDPLAAATSSAPSRSDDEVMGVLRPQVGQLRQCLGAGAPPTTFTLLIHADGSGLLQTSSPDLGESQRACVRQLVESLQFPANTGDAQVFTTPPIQ